MNKDRKNKKKLNIAFLGIRGIPANYGGFETFVEEIAPRLVDKGHQITVYGRTNNIQYEGTFYKGVRIKLLPTIPSKYLDTIAHTFISALHVLFYEKYDVVLMMNAANSPFAIFPRLKGAKVALNVDGIERLRKKWGKAGKLYYKMGEWLATKIPHHIVSDAQMIEDYYQKTYQASSTMIAYGANTNKVKPAETLQKFNLTADHYFLYVTRLEPENNPDLLIKAYQNIQSEMPLVIVGDAPYAKQYIATLNALAASDSRVKLTGAIYGVGYRELISNAFAYVQATEVGGTHPALIEAMAVGNCVIVNGTTENKEVVADSALIYQKNDIEDLTRQMQTVIDNPTLRKTLAKKAVMRVQQKFSWAAVTEKYEKLFFQLVNNH